MQRFCGQTEIFIRPNLPYLYPPPCLFSCLPGLGSPYSLSLLAGILISSRLSSNSTSSVKASLIPLHPPKSCALSGPWSLKALCLPLSKAFCILRALACCFLLNCEFLKEKSISDFPVFFPQLLLPQGFVQSGLNIDCMD